MGGKSTHYLQLLIVRLGNLLQVLGNRPKRTERRNQSRGWSYILRNTKTLEYILVFQGTPEFRFFI